MAFITHPDDFDNAFPMTEMAYSKKEIFQILFQLNDARITHLLKLFYFPTFTDYTAGWIITVYKTTSRIYRDKATNKLPTEEFIYNTIWGGQDDVFSAHLKGIVKDFNDKLDPDYKYLPVIFNKNEAKVRKYMTEYFKWLSKQLSKNGKVTLSEVSSVITQLLNKYAK